MPPPPVFTPREFVKNWRYTFGGLIALIALSVTFLCGLIFLTDIHRHFALGRSVLPIRALLLGFGVPFIFSAVIVYASLKMRRPNSSHGISIIAYCNVWMLGTANLAWLDMILGSGWPTYLPLLAMLLGPILLIVQLFAQAIDDRRLRHDDGSI